MKKNKIAKHGATTKPKEPMVVIDDPIYIKYGQAVIGDGSKAAVNSTASAFKFGEEYKVAYDANKNEFVRYLEEKGYWAALTQVETERLIAKFLEKLAVDYKCPKIHQQKTTNTLSSIAGMVKIHCSFIDEKKNSRLFPVANGVLDLSGDQPTLLTHDPKYGFRSASDYPYVKEANCERFLTELLKPALSEDDISLTQRYMGSLLLGPNLPQRMLIMKGDAGAGKSTVVTIVESIIGEHQTAYLRTNHLDGQFEFSAFKGVRLLCGKDVPTNTLSKNGAKLLKSLIGGDKLQDRKKYSNEARHFIGDFHVIIHCNAGLKIALEGDDQAWKRRLLIVDFKKTTKTSVPGFADVLLKEEGPGILNWLVQGAIAHAKELKNSGNFVLTDDQNKKIENMIDESRSAEVFVQTGIRKTEEGSVTTRELTQAYHEFCTKRGWDALSEKEFQKGLPTLMQKYHQKTQAHNIQSDNSTSVRGYRSVELVQEP